MQFGKATAAIAIAALGVSVVGGCASIEEQYGIGIKTQVAAAGGAAAGGLIAAAAGAGSAWIATSLFLGALAGGAAGEFLNADDKARMAQSGYEALKSRAPDSQTAWRNPATGNSGATTIDEWYVNADGVECKRFTQTITADGKGYEVTGAACRQADGTWKVVTS